MRKRPVSIAFSDRVLRRIDQEASRQKRSRSDYQEKFFEDLFFPPEPAKPEIAMKLG